MTCPPHPAPTLRFITGSRETKTRARMRYAFQAYAAHYGFRVVTGPGADLAVGHGDVDEPVDVVLPAAYRPRPTSAPAPAPTWVEGMPCFHLSESGAPDVLGEVFEWLAAPHELACDELDDIGRVPPQHTLAGTHRLDRRVPWVNRWLSRLHCSVRAALPRLPATPPSPFRGGHTFVASHDLDHLSSSRAANTMRIAKNVAIAVVQERNPRLGLQITREGARRSVRRMPAIVGVSTLLTGEADRGVRSTYTVVPESLHRRDPGYKLDDDFVRATLEAIRSQGHEIGVHGSYQSAARPGQLAREYDLLARAGFRAAGGRQHWLRHRGGELYRELAEAGARWDSTSGHPDDMGYRHGAAFPFLPYDFERERAHPIVEIPLVVMDRALSNTSVDPAAWPGAAVDVLHAAGKDGWGGVAVLWHDDIFTGTAGPSRLADAYWSILDSGDRWTTAAEVAAAVSPRWAAAAGGRQQ